ncbi:type IV pili twitching motility protein PilT [Luminiphilus syltensis NOR5-1B]|uniref:Type IV pili twitching motility protein PilT n=1 Tax=Luminiphilus syltensis NOR5-1B TaxID=565045 RepID=B8KU74_9GAMM|nr:PilT/PilU family type 4a pilus ATPase [Luminiphilus syltensis]EED34320.1 type IV pili twitching motility protein PilT [Luminiphilus syltensis NOR5-1B]
MDIQQFLKVMVNRSASDGFLTVASEPVIKVDGELIKLDEEVLGAEQVGALIDGTLSDVQRREFREHHECNYAINDDQFGRFRASAFIQRGLPGLALRRISAEIPSIEDLNLPPIIEKLAMIKRGLVIFVGGTGTGKSTSLASMIDYRNRNSHGHIITVEDPIEFIHSHKGCLMTQREVGIDTESYEVALKNTLRQAPDVIMIGEVRTAETMQAALSFAETGHLCLCTLHANNANQALDRIQSFFPEGKQKQVWMDLSLNMKAMVAQQLLPRRDGDGRTPVIEVLLSTPLIQDHIRKGEVHMIKELMERSTELGMQTFDQSLVEAYKKGLITDEQAERNADSGNDVRLQIKLHERGQSAYRDGADLDLEVERTRQRGM